LKISAIHLNFQIKFQGIFLYLQPPHFQPSRVDRPCLLESQLQSVKFPELHACVTECTTPALVTA
jgi:hypothetical protein